MARVRRLGRIMRHVGVDGCRAGWIAVARGEAGLQFRIFQNFPDLVSAFSDAERILVDVPIGLPSPQAPIRPCDQRARQVLGHPRRSSVFPVPCREAVRASTFDQARKINQSCLGRSLSVMTWCICDKIAEVDTFLLSGRASLDHVREVHPEVCFWALAERRPMEHSKKTAEGRAERRRHLQRHEPRVSQLLSEVSKTKLRKDVQEDDVLDAAVAFVTAEPRFGELDSLAGTPSHDEEGLRIEMLYLRTWE